MCDWTTGLQQNVQQKSTSIHTPATPQTNAHRNVVLPSSASPLPCVSGISGYFIFFFFILSRKLGVVWIFIEVYYCWASKTSTRINCCSRLPVTASSSFCISYIFVVFFHTIVFYIFVFFFKLLFESVRAVVLSVPKQSILLFSFAIVLFGILFSHCSAININGFAVSAQCGVAQLIVPRRFLWTSEILLSDGRKQITRTTKRLQIPRIADEHWI